MGTLCDWKSGDGPRLDDCEDCGKPIPEGGDVHYISDGYPSCEGTYVGPCCIERWVTKPK